MLLRQIRKNSYLSIYDKTKKYGVLKNGKEKASSLLCKENRKNKK